MDFARHADKCVDWEAGLKVGWRVSQLTDKNEPDRVDATTVTHLALEQLESLRLAGRDMGDMQEWMVNAFVARLWDARR